MHRKLICFGILLTMVAPAFAQRSQGRNGRGHGTQLRQRVHDPGTGQQTGAGVRQRDRMRDGTGMNCPNRPCAQTQTQTQTEAKAETQNQAQSASHSQVRTRTERQTKTQPSKPAPKN